MPKIISEETRLKILQLAGENKTEDEIAQELGINRRTVIRWLSRHAHTGTMREAPRSGRPRVTTPAQDRTIVDATQENPTRTARSLFADMAAPYFTSVRRLHEAGLTLRVMKKREAALQDERKRAARVEWVERADRTWSDWAESTVWVDETMCESKNSHRKRAWADSQTPAAERPVHYVGNCGKSSQVSRNFRRTVRRPAPPDGYYQRRPRLSSVPRNSRG